MESEVYRFRLRKNYDAILKDLEPRRLLGLLYQDDVFDEDEMEEVRSERTRKRQAERLLNMLSTKTDAEYSIFVKALETKQPHLAKIMNTPVPNEELGIHSLGKSKSLQPQQIDMQDLARMLHFNMNYNEAVERTFPEQEQHLQETEGGWPVNFTSDAGHDFRVKPTRLEEISPHYQPNSLDSVYDMRSSPRGLAVIINVMNFDPDPTKHCSHDEKLEKRDGSEVDVQSLKKLFTCLDFKVKLFTEDEKEEDLRKELLKISTDPQLSKYSCLAMCIMSHGKNGSFYCHDGGQIKISDIKNMFSNSNCKYLSGKPKMFFIQACRGQKIDMGRTVSDGPSEHSDQYNFNKNSLVHNARPSTSDNADILLAYSSVEGYTTYRHTSSGSRFIKWLVLVFKECACFEDVESMLTRVIKEVNKEGVLGEKQVPKPETTLTKKVFFWPGMIFEHN